MAHNVPPGTQYAVHMRTPSSSSGKDWVGSVDANNVFTSQWGKTGSINQRAEKNGGISDLTKVQAEKDNKGYYLIDTFTESTGWQIKPPSSFADPGGAAPKQPKPHQPATPDLSKIAPVPDGAISYDF